MRSLRAEVAASAYPPQPNPAFDPDELVIRVPIDSIQRRVCDRVIRCYRRLHGFDFKYFKDGSRVVGVSLGGPWDRGALDVLSVGQWEGFRQHFVEGLPWNEVSPYREQLQRLSGNDLKKLLTKMELWDAVFEDMRANGYRRQGEVRGDAKSTINPNEGSALNEVQVAVARSGEILRISGGGKHRFMMAKILNIPEIPVVVNVLHARCTAIAPLLGAARAAADQPMAARAPGALAPGRGMSAPAE